MGSSDLGLPDEHVHPDIQRVIDGEELTNGGFQRAVCIQLKTIFDRQIRIYSYYESCKGERLAEIRAINKDLTDGFHAIDLQMQKFSLTTGILKFFAGAGILSVIGILGYLGKLAVETLIKKGGAP